MIFGVGTDLASIPRFESLLERFGERFVAKLLAPSEVAGFKVAADPARYLAKRFAAKEAFAKALGTGLRSPVLLNHLAVEHDGLGRPSMCFDRPIADLLSQLGAGRVHLSLSDEAGLALAFVTIELKREISC